jgi:hypothetical protein
MLHRIARAIERIVARGELRHHPAVTHRPTGNQVRQYADLGGYEPLTYDLDPDANWMPDGLVLEHRHGLAFTFRDAAGRLHETVVLPGGERFELFAPLSEQELMSLWDPRSRRTSGGGEGAPANDKKDEMPRRPTAPPP